MSDKEPIAWITRGGKHIPIFDEDYEPNKEDQIEKNKKQADKLNKESGSKSNSLEDKYKNINPNFKKDASSLDKDGWNNNCVKCALAFEANMRGEDVAANPYKFGQLGERDMSKQVYKAFGQKQGDMWNVGRSKKEDTVREIELMMTEDWGKGSRAIIQEDVGGKSHTMNVINDNGKVIIVDAQSGKHGSVKDMLKGVNTKSMIMFRTDDLKMDSTYSEWAYKKR